MKHTGAQARGRSMLFAHCKSEFVHVHPCTLFRLIESGTYRFVLIYLLQSNVALGAFIPDVFVLMSLPNLRRKVT